MHFKIAKKEFLVNLQSVSRAISSFSPLPAFSAIKFEVTSNSIVLTGSDSDISIQNTLYSDRNYFLEIYKEGSILIEAKYITEIVRKINSDIIELEVIDHSLTKISGHSAKFNINGMPAYEYPAIDFAKPEKSFTLNSDTFKKAVSQTVFAASDKETRPVLTGVNFSCENHHLDIIATDSYRLAKKMLRIEEDLKFNITIPAKALKEVVKSLEENTDILIAINDKKAQFSFQNSIVQTRLIDGNYPDTRRLIPENFSYSLEVDAKEMLGSIDRASFIKNEGISVIKMSLSELETNFSTRSIEVGSYTDKLESAKFNGQALDISFNGKYVFDAIRELASEKVVFKFCGDMHAFIIVSLEDDSIVQLVLPVRTYA